MVLQSSAFALVHANTLWVRNPFMLRQGEAKHPPHLQFHTQGMYTLHPINLNLQPVNQNLHKPYKLCEAHWINPITPLNTEREAPTLNH